MKKKIIFGVVAFLVVAGVIAVLLTVKKPQPAKVGNIDIKNATYLIDGQAVTLTNGISQEPIAPGSSSILTTRYFGNEAVGDFNGDGKNDTAFLVTQSGPGSGTFFYVVVALASSNGVIGTNAVFLGDRIAPQSTVFMNGSIVVNYATRLDSEPMSSVQSVGVSKYFVVNNHQLVEVNK